MENRENVKKLYKKLFNLKRLVNANAYSSSALKFLEKNPLK